MKRALFIIIIGLFLFSCSTIQRQTKNEEAFDYMRWCWHEVSIGEMSQDEADFLLKSKNLFSTWQSITMTRQFSITGEHREAWGNEDCLSEAIQWIRTNYQKLAEDENIMQNTFVVELNVKRR